MPAADFRADRPILLVGPMGSGKSTVGVRLAERLGLRFVDSDREIERSEGIKVAAIFERFGEKHFRRREREVMARLAAAPPQVIAAGGGAFVDEPVRSRLLAVCTTFWLDADPAILADRLGAAADRPLLEGRDPEAALSEIAATRNSAYAQAHHRIEVGSLTPDEVVAAILGRLSAG
jgi:shikimate kinase